MIKILDSGIVYRNPKPFLRSIHAWHPSLAVNSKGELFATFDLGEAIESLNYRTYGARSTDGGATWSDPKPILEDQTERRSTHSVRVGSVSDGSLVCFGARFYRDNPEEGLVNRANMGYVPIDLLLLRSQDFGNTWTKPQVIQTPFVGPSFEVCHAVVELKDGRWLIPTSTWRGWNGESPNGMVAIALVSHDRGKTWPDVLHVFNQHDHGIFSWEQGLTQLNDGRLLSTVWCFDEKAGKSLPNVYAISDDGKTFSPPRENGLIGETAKLITLPDGRVLCLYRRRDQPGLWAATVAIEGDKWNTLEQVPIWQGTASGMFGVNKSADELSALKFGYPIPVLMPNGDIVFVHWCVEESIHIIRWHRLRIE